MGHKSRARLAVSLLVGGLFASVQLALWGDVSAQAELLSVSYSSYVNHESWRELFSGKVYTGDFLHVVGEVTNLVDTGLEYVVVVELYDSRGERVEAERYWRIGPGGELPPGQKRPFLLILLNETAGRRVARLDVSVTVEETCPWLRYGARFLNVAFDRESGRVVGELENELDLTMEHPTLYLTLYNSSGHVVGADYGGIEGARRLAPGATAPFDVDLDNIPSSWRDMVTDYSLYASYAVSYKQPYGQLEILDPSLELDEFGWFKVTGRVRNAGESDARYVQVAVSLIDARGVIYRCDSTYAQPTSIPPGETSSFSLDFLSQQQPATYRLYVYSDTYVKKQSQISCTVEPGTVVLGGRVEVSGAIQPLPMYNGKPTSERVTIHFQNPLGQEATRSTTTNVDTAAYFLSVEPDLTGCWTVWSSWDGMNDLTNATADTVVFDVTKRREVVPVQYGDKTSVISIVSNYSIRQLSFSEQDGSLRYWAYYSSGWYWPIQQVAGGTTLTIPRQILEPPFTVWVDGEEVSSTLATNSTHSSVSYHHILRPWGSTVRIVGTIAELEPSIWPLLGLILSLLAAFGRQRLAPRGSTVKNHGR